MKACRLEILISVTYEICRRCKQKHWNCSHRHFQISLDLFLDRWIRCQFIQFRNMTIYSLCYWHKLQTTMQFRVRELHFKDTSMTEPITHVYPLQTVLDHWTKHLRIEKLVNQAIYLDTYFIYTLSNILRLPEGSRTLCRNTSAIVSEMSMCMWEM